MTITRFAPSPTGHLHVGNLRTALFNWLIARKAGGTFVLRIDDTDPERSRPEYADQIRRDLEWLGLTWDREAEQSQRLDLYMAAADRLREADRLYDCYETPEELALRRRKQLNLGRPPVYDRSARNLSDDDRAALAAAHAPHWRFLLDQTRIMWTDLILGPQDIDAASVSDPVLIRADGQMLYTLASVVDDADMAITHVVRGSDHVTNTATQIQIFEALGKTAPDFAHHSLLTGAAGQGLSKRDGALSLMDLREAGVEPMALLSHLARLGSSDPMELRKSHDELVAGFDIARFGAAPTRFDADDLTGLTARVLHATDYDAVAERLRAAKIPDAVAPEFWGAVHQNIERFDDVAAWWAICQGDLTPVVSEEDAAFVREALSALPPRPWTTETWGEWTGAMKASSGRKGKALFMPLRRALTGLDRGPDMATLMPLLQGSAT